MYNNIKQPCKELKNVSKLLCDKFVNEFLIVSFLSLCIISLTNSWISVVLIRKLLNCVVSQATMRHVGGIFCFCAIVVQCSVCVCRLCS